MDSALSDYLAQVTRLAGGSRAVPAGEGMENRFGAGGRAERDGISPPPAPIITPTAPITNPNQVVYPAKSWDWPDTVPGSIDFEQFAFADTVPASILANTEYAPTSNSFSESYRTFLEYLDASVPLLADAKARIATPSYAPASGPTPPGWTKTSVEGLTSWVPVWSLSDSASAWKAKVDTGAIDNPGTLELGAQNHGSLGSFLQGKPSDADTPQDLVPNVASVKMTARAWGQIAIYPGTWFEASMIKLGKSHVAQDGFFGNGGLLSGRVSAFLVAYGDITYEFASKDQSGVSLAKTVADARDMRAFGIPVQVAASQPPVAAGTTSVRLAASTQNPAIVAVLIESFS